MNSRQRKIERPQRWDEPFDVGMDDAAVAKVKQVEPFASMESDAFSKTIPLDGILKNDCRLLQLEAGDIIVREGDYGNSAFLILSGEAIVSLKKLPENLLGRSERKPNSWWASLKQGFKNSKYAEVRTEVRASSNGELGTREDGDATRVFLHDIPRVIPASESVVLKTGEVFGEISALTRSPRSATVVAHQDSVLLEIRWQGFRELLKRHEVLKQHVDRLYRENSLRAHLREVDIFENLSTEDLAKIEAVTEFKSFGDFQWNQKFKSTKRHDIADRILAEEVIAGEGWPADDLILIRSGFARLSREHGDGHQTIAYLGKGQTFGLREIAHNFSSGERRGWMLGLRALGYVDVLMIPAEVVQAVVLRQLPKKRMPSSLPPVSRGEAKSENRRLEQRDPTMDTSLLEFLVEKRFINGVNTMMIDLDRCTRCDDCVRACASTHDNNPRFNRSGEIHDHWMVANACMHCLDPVCMIGCPTGAIGRDADTGNVTINDRTCIGCSTCANSCPYGNIQMVEVNDTKGLPIIDSTTGRGIAKATKCDLCNDHRGGPACQRACPHDALVRIDLSTPDKITDWTNSRAKQ